MGYGSRGRKPVERASKIAHAEIIKNPQVQAYVRECVLPSTPDLVSLDSMVKTLGDVDTSAVTAVIAVDGGYTETYLREEYPSSSITFFTFGPLLFELADLRALDRSFSARFALTYSNQSGFGIIGVVYRVICSHVNILVCSRFCLICWAISV